MSNDPYQRERVLAIQGDALAYFASAEVCEQAAVALDNGEFRAWSPEDQRAAAIEIRALSDCYHDNA